MSVTIESFEFRTRPMSTRFPFRYGIAAMTELPHVFLRLRAVIDGKSCAGLASEGLPPKWFTKDATTRFEEDLPQMTQVLEQAAGLACGIKAQSLFAFWQELYQQQDEWARGKKIPPLLAHLGTALVERALIDAFCRSAGMSFSAALKANAFGIDLGKLHPELATFQPADLLPEHADTAIIARHTIGLGDPIKDTDIPAGERCDDGLPQALDAVIDHYGLTHFKVKICGDLQTDIARLRAIAALLEEKVPAYRFTLDGNEQYPTIGAFREHWEKFLADPALAVFLGEAHLLFVEQPIHRDHALNPEVAEDIRAWDQCPAMIIDESDGEVDSLRFALKLGYRGTSHKNCKGVFKGIANACLLEHLRGTDDGSWILSGEDLANVGPVALLNDLAVMAALGVGHVERNGHHYFSGLSMYPQQLQDAVCAAHPDLYGPSEKGFATLRIAGGKLAAASLVAAPFGCGLELSDEILDRFGEGGLP
jgi:L-alanine-DL-glutamate epimerase-like enolase superfamily enzyme